MMHKQAQLGTRIDAKVKRAVDAACRARGIKMGRFVEDALVGRLEEIADGDEIERLKREPSRPAADVFRDLGIDGV